MLRHTGDTAAHHRRFGSELIIVALDGRIVFARPRARRWLAKLAGAEVLGNAVPAPLLEWMQLPVKARRERLPFATMLADALLLVRMAGAETEPVRCLALELRPLQS